MDSDNLVHEHDSAGITVLIPTYNREKILSQTLGDLARLNPPGVDFEVVVIDNASLDGTSEVVRHHAAQLDLTYLRESRPGKNCALNKALQEVKLRDIVVFADDDITPTPNWLVEIVRSVRQHPGCSVFGGRVQVELPETKIPKWTKIEWIRLFGFASHDLGDSQRLYQPPDTPMGPNYWVRRSVFRDVPRFDESIGPRPKDRIMGSEVSFLMDLSANGFEMRYWPWASVEHRIQAEECNLTAMKRRAFRYGRGEVKLYGLHRGKLHDRSQMLWSVVMIVDLGYAILRLLLSNIFVGNLKAKVSLRAMIRIGKIFQSSTTNPILGLGGAGGPTVSN